jgi:hypothetical protein
MVFNKSIQETRDGPQTALLSQLSTSVALWFFFFKFSLGAIV